MSRQRSHAGFRSFMWKSLVLAAAFAFVVAAMSACGSSGEEGGAVSDKKRERTEAAEPTPIEEVRVAYRNTAEADTARTVMEMNMTGIPVGEGVQTAEMRMTMRGVTDFAGEKSRYTMEMPMLGRMEVRQIGDVIYQKFPPELMAEAPDGATWVRTDLDAMMEDEMGMSLSEMQSGAPADMTGQLEYLKSVSDSVEEIGEEEIRGTQTTRYRANVDLEKEAEGMSGQMRETYDDLIEQMGATTLPMEVWLDEEGIVRRFEMTVPMAAPPGVEESMDFPEDAEVEISQELFDFGTPLEVVAPPESETVGMEELVSQQNAAMNPPGGEG